ncbi:MAG: group I truncated hemoglobin, partial [Vicinamibacteria bacterium]
MMTRSSFTAAALLAGFTVASLSSALPGQAPTPSEPSLYDRLGGLYNIAAVVDSFIEKLVVNPTLNANPAINAARRPERLPGLKVHVST